MYTYVHIFMYIYMYTYIFIYVSVCLGVLLVYPDGDWYGLITKRNISELLDNIMKGTRYLKGWRGNETTDW
jgi:(2Fe-2S) ferredoxin